MEQLIAFFFLAFIFYALRWEWGPPPKKEADFDEHKKDYLNDGNREVVEDVEEVEIVNDSPVLASNNKQLQLPPHLQDKVVYIQMGNKWTKVVDVKFLEI